MRVVTPKPGSVKTPQLSCLAGAALGLSLSLLPGLSWAVLIDSAITITGQVEFDSLGAPQAPVGNATQSGSLTRIVGGTTTTTTLTNSTIVGADPLAGVLSDVGDGFGVKLMASGTSAGAEASARNLFGDLFLSLVNASATDTFNVTLRIDFDSATSASGADAFGAADLLLIDNLMIERFFSQIATDTVGGDRKFVFPSNTDVAATTGAAQGDSGSFLLALILSPGSNINFGTIPGAEFRIDGGAFAPGSFSTSLDALITVDSVTNLTDPGGPDNPVPVPATLLLLIPGLLGMGAVRRLKSAA
jgi:hypothetical protein